LVRDRRWPRQYLEDILTGSVDAESFIRLFPIITIYVQGVYAEHAVKLLRTCALKLARRWMLAVLPALVHLFLERMDAFTTVPGDHEDDGDLTRLLEMYGSFIGSLDDFANPTGWDPSLLKQNFCSQPLPTPVMNELLRIVRHLLSTMERLPTSSDPKRASRLNKDLLSRLFSHRYLSPELRKILLLHTEEKGITLSSWHWHQCFLSAATEGDTESARHFLGEKRKAIPGQAVQSMTKGSELLVVGRGDEDGAASPYRTTNSAEQMLIAADRQRIRLAAESRLRDGEYWPLSRQKDDILLLSQCSSPPARLLDKLERYLQPTAFEPRGEQEHDAANCTGDPSLSQDHAEGRDGHALLEDDITPYAWSIFLSLVAEDMSIDADELLGLVKEMPESVWSGHTLTPVMHGLVERGEAQKAWAIWRGLVKLAKNADQGDHSRYIDNASLAVACEACYGVSNLAAAITLVDLWARRPGSCQTEETGMLHSVLLDAQTVNVLLNLCRRDRLPSVAFRLWSAALPRWNVYLNDISLGLLMETARIAESNDSMSSHAADGLMAALCQLRDEMSLLDVDTPGVLRRTGDRDYDAYDANGFAKGSVSVLLDAPGESWRKAHGGRRPWQLAREVFRDVVLSNWPHLADVKSPLDLQTGPLAYLSSFFGGQYTSSQSTDTLKRPQIPSQDTKYVHIVPTALRFYIYIALIGYHNMTSEIPLVLAWMKEVEIRPTWKTMCWAICYVAEFEGPSRRVTGWGPRGQAALVRDSQLLRRWLVDWLGESTEVHDGEERSVVPTEWDVTRFRMELMSSKVRLTGRA